MNCKECNNELILMTDEKGFRKLKICPVCREYIIFIENKTSEWRQSNNE